VRIVVLTKPVPDPASGGERLRPDGTLDRANSPAVVNGNDEYVLEKALKLIEAAGEGEVILLSMAPATGPETMRKALAMGATRGVLVSDPALAGSCVVATTRVLAAALQTLEFDLVFAGVDSSDRSPSRGTRSRGSSLPAAGHRSRTATAHPTWVESAVTGRSAAGRSRDLWTSQPGYARAVILST